MAVASRGLISQREHEVEEKLRERSGGGREVSNVSG
jgi:hypothetical protein